MDQNQPSKSPCHAHRVIASLNREQVDFLDKIGKDAQFSSGTKLSQNQILAAMVNALKRLNLTAEGVTTIGQFEQRVVEAIMSNSNGHPARRSKSQPPEREPDKNKKESS